jgi:hypothetical protein
MYKCDEGAGRRTGMWKAAVEKVVVLNTFSGRQYTCVKEGGEAMAEQRKVRSGNGIEGEKRMAEVVESGTPAAWKHCC